MMSSKKVRVLSIFVLFFLMLHSQGSADTLSKAQDTIDNITKAAQDAKSASVQSGAAEESLGNNLFADVFLYFSDKIGECSYNEADEYLTSLDFSVEATEPTNSDFGQFSITDENGDYITIMFHPLDGSWDSQEFGDKDKEMIMLLSYHSGESSISIDTNGHTTFPEYSTFDRVNGSVSVPSVKDLMRFYQDEMGGVVSDDLAAANWSSNVSEESIVRDIHASAKKYFDDDYETTVRLYGKNVIIEATGRDNLTANLIKTGIWSSIYNVLNDARDMPISIDFLISFPMVDAKGNDVHAVIVKASFYDLSKIGWDNFLFIDVPVVADKYWQHPALPE